MEDGNRANASPGVNAYYTALQKILSMQRDILTGVLPHAGERGRNDEERLRQFLRQVLPQRFGIGTGFIISSNPSADPSNQIDIIIADQFVNSPIHRELAAEIYPIETVVATIEVKGSLSSGRRKDAPDLGRSFESIARVRALAQDKRYVEYRSVSKKGHPRGHKVVCKRVIRSSLPPRSYVFAYHTNVWADISSLAEYVERCLDANEAAVLHGLVVLDKNWFLKQQLYTGPKRHVLRHEEDCLLRFVNALLRGIQSIPMYPMDIDAYQRSAGGLSLTDASDVAQVGKVEEEAEATTYEEEEEEEEESG